MRGASRWSGVFGALVGVAVIAAITIAFRSWLELGNPTIAALTYLLVVLVTATLAPLWVAICISVVADLFLNYFFLPPLGTFAIAEPENWVALFAFLAVSLTASNLSSAVSDRAREAIARRDELTRLFDLSRDVLLTTDSRNAIQQLASFIARRFDLDYAAICLPRSTEWDVFEGGTLTLALDQQALADASSGLPSYASRESVQRMRAGPGEGSPRGAPGQVDGHGMVTIDSHAVRLVPLRLGMKAVGLLAVAGRPVEPGTLDAIAGIAAIAIERAQFLEERKSAELARQSEELKSALLASLAHDLRTPLTAIRVAAGNLQASWLADEERHEQSDLIVAEVERLNRLFQNILEMARIDAGAVAPETRWVHLSEIVEVARDHVEPMLGRHRIEVAIESDALVRVDPLLTASALAHVLENAAQYTPAGSPITLSAAVSAEGLVARVRDRGPGIAADDLPHLFDRFYRGSEAKQRVAGTGMGLSIARGLVAAERGRIWAENCADGGAQFTIVVPAETSELAAINGAS